MPVLHPHLHTEESGFPDVLLNASFTLDQVDYPMRLRFGTCSLRLFALSDLGVPTDYGQLCFCSWVSDAN